MSKVADIHLDIDSEKGQQRRPVKDVLRKYFVDGPQPEKVASIDHRESRFIDKHKRYVALLIPFSIIQVVWWLTAIRYEWFAIYPKNIRLPLIVLGASTIGGTLSVGAAVMAFPIMTLLVGLDAIPARDFALGLQTVGLAATMFVILFMRVRVEKNAILCTTLGSVPGILIGFYTLDNTIPDVYKKLLYVCVFGLFTITRFILNVEKKRVVFDTIPHVCAWKRAVMILAGFIGGLLMSVLGSGVDACSFAVMTLLFRVCQQTATPTTVVILGVNSVFSLYWRVVWQNAVASLTWEWIAVSIPIAATMAPIGSVIGAHFHRMVHTWIIYLLEIVFLLGFLYTAPSTIVLIPGLIVIFLGFAFLSFVSFRGKALAESILAHHHPDHNAVRQHMRSFSLTS